MYISLLHQNAQIMSFISSIDNQLNMSTKFIWVKKKVDGTDEGDEVEIEVDVENGNVSRLIQKASGLLTKDIPIADMFLMVDNIRYGNRIWLREIEKLGGDDVPTVFICWNNEKRQVKDNLKGTKIDVCVCICNIHNCYTLHFHAYINTTRDIITPFPSAPLPPAPPAPLPPASLPEPAPLPPDPLPPTLPAPLPTMLPPVPATQLHASKLH